MPGQCPVCLQTRDLIADGKCGPCAEGLSRPYRYECDRCHGVQRIPHPMWKYQGKPDEFTGATWACHVGCGDYTHWRITPTDLAKIPGNGAESWGARESWIDKAEEEDDDVEDQEEEEEADKAASVAEEEKQDEPTRCGMCNQLRELEDGNYCGPCLEGMQQTFCYECDRCHNVQSIPHPMWKYQGKADEFTGATWACHMACHDYTHWRIVANDLAKIPGDGVETWGPREKWLPPVEHV